VERHEAIALEVRHWTNWCINRKLVVVDTKSMAVCIRVREETALENWIGRGLHTRNEMRWRERGLFDFSEVVLRILVEHKLADFSKREVLVWPDLGEIENVITELLGLLGSHRLDEDCPGRELASLD
jgi:hypothetical protein